MNGKQRYITYISWALTIAAYIYIGYKIYTYDDWSSLSAHLDSADAIAYICGIVALGLMPVNMLMEAWRWQYLVGGISIREAQRQVYFSKIAGQLTPYQLGEYPARGLLMKQTKWSELLSLGAVGSMTMTLAIAIVGVVPLLIWLIDGVSWSPNWWVIGITILAVVVVTLLLPRLLRRWVDISYTVLFASLGQSILRYLCWCVQLALVLRLFSLPITTEWLILIPTYYLLITLFPSISIAEVGVRGAAALWVFGTMEATLAGVLLWAINSLLPMLIGTFVKKNAK